MILNINKICYLMIWFALKYEGVTLCFQNNRCYLSLEYEKHMREYEMYYILSSFVIKIEHHKHNI